MECIKINETELKVSLNADEADLYAITDMKRGFRALCIKEIILYAGIKCGFDINDSKLFVEMFTVKSGDCEIFVRKIGKHIKADFSYCENIYIYSFGTLSDMMNFIKVFYREEHETFMVYKNDGREFYIIVDSFTPLYQEYFGKLLARESIYYIKEHCTALSVNTVKLLSELS